MAEPATDRREGLHRRRGAALYDAERVAVAAAQPDLVKADSRGRAPRRHWVEGVDFAAQVARCLRRRGSRGRRVGAAWAPRNARG